MCLDEGNFSNTFQNKLGSPPTFNIGSNISARKNEESPENSSQYLTANQSMPSQFLDSKEEKSEDNSEEDDLDQSIEINIKKVKVN